MRIQSTLTLTLLFGLIALTSACREKAAEEVKEAIEVHGSHMGEHSHQMTGDEEGHMHEHPAAADADVPMVFDSKPPAGTKARCPVMKDVFTVKEDSPTATYKGKTYVFCCPGCKPQFEENPEKYL